MKSESRVQLKGYLDRLMRSGRYLFTSQEARESLGASPDAVKLAINRLRRKGDIASPARGFYVIVPPEYRALGFKAIKFGWGVFGYDLQQDIALVRAAREEAGAEIELMVDAGWYGTSYANPYKPRPLRDWIRLVKALEELDVFWLEDFIHPDNFAGYGAVAAHTTTLRLAAGEQLAGYEAFERLAEEGQVHTLQPDLSRCGGLTVGKQIADLALRKQIDCVPHAWLSDLLKAASLHLNAYTMNSLYLEYNVSSASLLNTLCRTPIVMVDGFVPVPTGPGLGVEVDEEVVARYRVL